MLFQLIPPYNALSLWTYHHAFRSVGVHWFGTCHIILSLRSTPKPCIVPPKLSLKATELSSPKSRVLSPFLAFPSSFMNSFFLMSSGEDQSMHISWNTWCNSLLAGLSDRSKAYAPQWAVIDKSDPWHDTLQKIVIGQPFAFTVKMWIRWPYPAWTV